MADLNKLGHQMVKRIANGEGRILFHLDEELRWDGPDHKTSKLSLDEKLAIVRRVHRALKRRKKNESE